MTQSPLPGLIARLAWPSILTMLVSGIYNIVDTAFVSQLGDSASGAVGIVFSLMSILQAFSFMFGQGSGTKLGRFLGARDQDGADRMASTGILSVFVLACLAGIIGLCILEPLVYFLGSTKTIAPYAMDYVRWILIGAPFICSSFTINNLLRFEGKARFGMLGMMSGGILNIALDALFIFGMDLGVAGAGLATALSQLVGFCILLSMYLRKKTSARFSPRKFTRSFREFVDILAGGFPSLLRQGLNALAALLLNHYAAVYGDAAVAAMSIVSRICFFIMSIAIGTGHGFQPVSSFNYGAGKYSRVRAAFIVTVLAAQLLLTAISAGVFACSGDLIRIFRDSDEVIRIGTRALRLQCGGLLFLPVTILGEMLYQSTGHKLGAAVMSGLRSGFTFIPALILLANIRGLSGIQEAQPLGFLLAFPIALLLILRFFRRLPKEDKPDSASV